jgi:hypothetical protein
MRGARRRLLTVGVLALAVAPATAEADIWTPTPSGTTGTITAIDYQAEDRFWFTTGSGEVFRRKADGTFERTLNTPGTVWNDVAFDPTGSVGYVVGNGGAARRSVDAGLTWSAPLALSTRASFCGSTPSGLVPLNGNLYGAAWAGSDVYFLGESQNTGNPTVQKSVASGPFAEVGKQADGTCRAGQNPLSDAFFLPSDPNKGWLHSDFFGDMAITSDGLASNAARVDSGLNGFDAVARLAVDPASPNRQWAVRPGGDGESFWSRTETEWAADLGIDPRPTDRLSRRPWDIAYAGGTVLIAGDAGDIVNSIDGQDFFFNSAEGALRTRDWRSVDLADYARGAVGGTGGQLVLTTRANTVPDVVAPTGAIAGPDQVTAGRPATFTAQLADTGGSGIDPAATAWTAPPDQPARGGDAVTYTWPNPGTYRVRLNYADRAGNAGAEVTRLVSVDAAPAITPPTTTTPGATTSPPPATRLPAATLPRRAPTVRFVRTSRGVLVRVGGGIALPRGVSRSTGCRGRVTITIRRGSRSIGRRTVRLNRRCRYGGAIRVADARLRGARRVRIAVRFDGNGRVRAVARAYGVRVRIR